MIEHKISRELDYRIRYDIENNLFHPQNIFSDKYVSPTFLEYVKNLEKENAKYKEMCLDMKADMCGTDNKVLFDYLIGILKKYEEIV